MEQNEKIKAFFEKLSKVNIDRPPLIETGREKLPLAKHPADLDFTKAIGGTGVSGAAAWL